MNPQFIHSAKNVMSRAEKRSAFRHPPSRIDDFYGHQRDKSGLRWATD